MFKLARGSYGKYARNKIVAAALGGAAVVAVTYALHAVIWNLISIPYSPEQYPYHELPFRADGFFAMWHLTSHAFPVYIYMFVTMGLFGAVWALIALAVSVWVPDKLLAITVPACIYQIWSGGIYFFLFGWRLPTPASLFLIDVNWTELWQSLLMYAIHIALAMALYMAGLKRRVANV